MEARIYLLVALISIGAGFLTASIGFGGAIFLMMFFPSFLPFVNATGLSSVIVYGGILLLTVEYRKHIIWKELILPVILYVACSVPVIHLVSNFDVNAIKLLFYATIILIGFYYLAGVLWPEKIKFRKSIFTTVGCSCLSGILTGLFGIGGPPMAGYFMAVTGDDKKAYIGTIQAFFAISMLFSISARFKVGIMPISYIPLALVGFATSLIGKRLGTVTLDKINGKILKIGICAFMIVSQLVNIANYLLSKG
jgi:uncharacterized protein